MEKLNAKISVVFKAKSDVASSIEYEISSCTKTIEFMKRECTDENGNISMPEWTEESISIYELEIEILENLLKQI